MLKSVIFDVPGSYLHPQDYLSVMARRLALQLQGTGPRNLLEFSGTVILLPNWMHILT